MIAGFAELKKNLKKDVSGLTSLRVAILGDNPTQLLHTAIRGHAIAEGFNFEVYEADFDQVSAEILNPQSRLYDFKPNFVCIFNSLNRLQEKFQSVTNSERAQFANNYLNTFSVYLNNLNERLKTNIILTNFPELDDGVFGNYANKTEVSFLFQIRKINLGLMELAIKNKNLFINDVALLNARLGYKFVFSPSLYISSNLAFSLDFLPYLAKNLVDIIKTIYGRFKKCLILDLDNTLWGGIIGDDGIDGIQIGSLGIGEAYSRLQRWAKQLKERGIILAICSKNEESIAREPFEKHPEMVLKLDDIAVFVANWNAKVDNIRYIQSVLNIGFDSMVFIDDNPVERKMVRDHLPQVTVPELPEDPAQYLDYLQELNLFETASFVEEDKDRTKQYQDEAKRVQFQKSFVNEEEFLKSLKMVCHVSSFNKFDYPRIAQLTQRSNQFNLRTIRYNEEEIAALANNPNYITLQFRLADTFGDYGLVSVVILKIINTSDLFIDTWLMSCRVLKRGLEQLVLNTIVQKAIQIKANKIIGEYIPTSKNGMVKDHYPKLGFTPTDHENKFELEVNSYKLLNHQISVCDA